MTLRTRLLACLAAAASFALTVPAPAHAGEAPWPTRPMRMVVPYPAGASTNDILGRYLANAMSDALGQSVVIDNRPGAGGTIGSELVAKAAPDGYTLLLGSNGPIAMGPHIYPKLGYEPLKDFIPIVMFALNANVIAMHPSVPAANILEFVALAKARPGFYNFASAGNGTTSHLCGELIKVMGGVNIVHVPYKGGGPAVNDLVANQVQLYCPGLAAVTELFQNGKLKPLGITTVGRTSAMPNVSTLHEQGLKGFDVSSWQGVLTPTRTPQAVVDRLNTVITRIARADDTVAFLKKYGSEPVLYGPQQFAEYLKAESDKWAHVAKVANVRAE